MKQKRLSRLRGFYRLDRIIEIMLRWLSYLSAISVILMAVIATLNVIAQKIFHGNISSANDYVTYLFVITIYAALPHVQMETFLTNVDILNAKFPKPVQLVVAVVGDAIGLMVFGYISYAMYTNVFIKYLASGKVATVGAAGTFPLWPFALLVALCTGLTALSFIWNNVRRIVYHGTKYIPLSLCHELGVEPPKRFGPSDSNEQDQPKGGSI